MFNLIVQTNYNDQKCLTSIRVLKSNPDYAFYQLISVSLVTSVEKRRSYELIFYGFLFVVEMKMNAYSFFSFFYLLETQEIFLLKTTRRIRFAHNILETCGQTASSQSGFSNFPWFQFLLLLPFFYFQLLQTLELRQVDLLLTGRPCCACFYSIVRCIRYQICLLVCMLKCLIKKIYTKKNYAQLPEGYDI